MIPLGVLASARVEAAGGGAFDADDYPGCTLWLKADALALADGATVSTWADSSAAANDASATGAFPAVYRASAINGYPAVELTGGGMQDAPRFTSPASSSGAEQTVFAVVLADLLTSNARTIRGASASGGLQVRLEVASGKQGLVKQLTANIGTSTSGVTVSTWNLLTYTFSDSGNAYAFRMNSAANGSGTSTQTLTAGLSTIIGGNVGAEFFDGQIAEVITYASLLNSTQIDAVESYLATKYAL